MAKAPSLEAILAAAEDEQRSVPAWLRKHYAEVEAARTAGRITWKALAAAFTKNGMPVKPDALRKAAQRIGRGEAVKPRRSPRPAPRPLSEVVTILPRPETPQAPAAAPEAQPRPGASDALARLQAQMAARKTPLPKVGE